MAVKKKLGRPRPEECVERDEFVLKALKKGRGKVKTSELAEDLDIEWASAYRALCRLRDQGLAYRSSHTTWAAA
jgi:predicted transcriptional regulator